MRSGRTIAQINGEEDLALRKNPFRRADVQLAELVDSVPKQGNWLYEVKYDGYRILAFIENSRARFATRNDNDYTQKFANVAEALGAWSEGRAMVLDGEMVVPDEEGKTSFQALQHAAKEGGEDSLVYMVFDLLALDGEDLRALPLTERKRRLEALCRKTPPCLSLSNHVEGKGEESLAAAQRMGLEGIVGKLADSPYRGERSGDWIKIKCYRRQEFVLGGYTRSNKNTSGVSALLLGVYEDGTLAYAGRAGTGISQSEADQLLRAFDKLTADECPFAGVPKARADEERFWLRPRLVAEVQFAEWTGEDVLRQASFKGLRADKDPTQVVREKPSAAPGEAAKSAAKQSATAKSAKPAAAAKKSTSAGPMKSAPKQSTQPTAAKSAGGKSAPKKSAAKKPATAGRRRTEREVVPPEARRAAPPPVGAIVCGVPISNPDKLVYTTPEVRKIDLVRYYERVAARMLPFAANRVLSVVRCHKGVDAACYFKKHPSAESAGVVVIPIENKEGEESDYFYLEDARGLIAEAQLGTIEFHVWGSRVETLEQPDMMVFDLDPDAGMPLEQVRQGVRDLKSVLDKLSLQSFLKVSGGKGYHVVVPFRPAVSWEVFHDFARRVAELMEQQWPDRYTGNMRKEKRHGKIFIDWVRNGRGATSVAPYSLRARPGARVSMPIAWRELDTVAPDGIDWSEALRRMRRSDPWKDFYAVDQQLQ